jgi:hypothetical protein
VHVTVSTLVIKKLELSITVLEREKCIVQYNNMKPRSVDVFDNRDGRVSEG